MNPATIFRAVATYAVVAVSANAHAQDVAACDLIQSTVVPELMSEPVIRHTPNRHFQVIDGSKVSDCIFFGKRHHVQLTLQEFPDPTKASHAYAKATVSDDFVRYSPAEGLGAKAVWWSGGAEASGYTVLKGKRILLLSSRWMDLNGGTGLKEKMRPAVLEAVGKL